MGNSLLLGKADLKHIPLTSLQKLYLSELRKPSDVLSSPLHHHISLSDMSQGFKKWKESTSTSPSNRHLGHYKSFLVLDGKANDVAHSFFNCQMLQNFNTILNAIIESGTPLTRWIPYIVLMIEKIPYTPRINILRIINIYETDYNLLQKFFWPKLFTKNAEAKHTLGEKSVDADQNAAQTTLQ